MPCGMKNLSSPTKDRTSAPAAEAQTSNHWTTREVPKFLLFVDPYSLLMFFLCSSTYSKFINIMQISAPIHLVESCP